MNNMFDEIFAEAVTEATAKALDKIAANPLTKTLDPLEDLKGGINRRIRYKRKVKNNSKSAFMVMHTKDLNWLSLLLKQIIEVNYSFSADMTIMLGDCSAKPQHGKTQSWEKFITELRTDKASQGQDFSEGQLRHLPVLLSLLSTQGKRMAGYGSVEFLDVDSGEVLS